MVLNTTMNNGESDHIKTKRIFFDKAVLSDNSIVEMTIWQLPKPSPERLLNVQTMLDTLSPRRLELLRHVRKHGANNVRELALVLARDYKNVHQDVSVLEATGLLIREGRKLSAPWDELQAHVSLR